MDTDTRRAYDASRDFADKPFRAGCYAPFTSMLFLPSGDAYVCCRNGVGVSLCIRNDGTDLIEQRRQRHKSKRAPDSDIDHRNSHLYQIYQTA